MIPAEEILAEKAVFGRLRRIGWRVLEEPINRCIYKRIVRSVRMQKGPRVAYGLLESGRLVAITKGES